MKSFDEPHVNLFGATVRVPHVRITGWSASGDVLVLGNATRIRHSILSPPCLYIIPEKYPNRSHSCPWKAHCILESKNNFILSQWLIPNDRPGKPYWPALNKRKKKTWRLSTTLPLLIARNSHYIPVATIHTTWRQLTSLRSLWPHSMRTLCATYPIKCVDRCPLNLNNAFQFRTLIPLWTCSSSYHGNWMRELHRRIPTWTWRSRGRNTVATTNKRNYLKRSKWKNRICNK